LTLAHYRRIAAVTAIPGSVLGRAAPRGLLSVAWAAGRAEILRRYEAGTRQMENLSEGDSRVGR
jgi:hypothetical protein